MHCFDNMAGCQREPGVNHKKRQCHVSNPGLELSWRVHAVWATWHTSQYAVKCSTMSHCQISAQPSQGFQFQFSYDFKVGGDEEMAPTAAGNGALSEPATRGPPVASVPNDLQLHTKCYQVTNFKPCKSFAERGQKQELVPALVPVRPVQITKGCTQLCTAIRADDI